MYIVSHSDGGGEKYILPTPNNKQKKTRGGTVVMANLIKFSNITLPQLCHNLTIVGCDKHVCT